MVLTTQHTHYCQIELRPNRSANWRKNKQLMMFLAIVGLIIPSVWAWLGLWFVFPFAGIEIGLVCIMLYKVSRQTYLREIISIESQFVHVQYEKKGTAARSFPVQDTHIELSESPQDWYLPGVYIVCGDEKLAIGDFLNHEDRMTLYETIKNLGIPAWRHHWWKH